MDVNKAVNSQLPIGTSVLAGRKPSLNFLLSVDSSLPRVGGSVAATCSDHHVAVLLQDDVGAVVKVEDRDAVELRGCTAGFGHRVWVDKMDLFLELCISQLAGECAALTRLQILASVCTMA